MSWERRTKRWEARPSFPVPLAEAARLPLVLRFGH
uniref:Uncharacterized protein n=1 Tax=Anguilla anguilla TaxID=7936 RepID=A0A0E9TW09_ANGAN